MPTQSPKMSLETPAVELSAVQSTEFLKLRLATELAPQSWKSGLVRFKYQLVSGRTWNDSISASNLPSRLRRLLESVSNCPDPIQTLTELLNARRNHRALARSLSPLLYPVLIVLGTFVLTTITAWLGWQMSRDVEWQDWWTGRKYDTIPMLFQSQIFRAATVAAISVWLLLIAAIVQLLAPRMMKLSLLIHAPWVGKIVRWSMLRDLLSTFRVYLESGLTTDQSANALVCCYRGSLLEIPAQGLADRLKQGQSIGQAVTNSMLSDEVFGPLAMTLLQANEQLTARLPTVSSMANRLFEQRLNAFLTLATRLGFVTVVCMYARIGMDISQMTQFLGGFGMSSSRFFGESSAWIALFPIAVVNYIFVHAMFRVHHTQNDSTAISLIKLFSGVCLAFACLGLMFRCTSSDIVYVIPLVVAITAIRKDLHATRRSATAQSLVAGVGDGANAEKMMTLLIANNRGGIRRRLRRFEKAFKHGTSTQTALSRSKLIVDEHQQWLVALRDKFGSMPVSDSILNMQSSWTALSDRLNQRLSGLKWIAIVSILGVTGLVVLQCTLFLPMFIELSGDVQINAPFLKYFSVNNGGVPGLEGLLDFIQFEMMDPWNSRYAGWIYLGCGLAYLLPKFWPRLRRWLISWFMRPIYRAWTLRGVGEALHTNHDLIKVLKDTSQIHPVQNQRNSLALIATKIENGLSAPDAFAKGKMIARSQRALLSLATEPRQLAWSLSQIAERNYFRFIERYLLAVDLLTLTIIILAASIVAVMGYIEFSVLSNYIKAVSQ